MEDNVSNKRPLSMSFTPRNVSRPGSLMGRGMGGGRGRGIGGAGRGISTSSVFGTNSQEEEPNSASEKSPESNVLSSQSDLGSSVQNNETQVKSIFNTVNPVNSISDYEMLDQLGKGEFGVVRKAKRAKNKSDNDEQNEELCIKELKFKFEDGFPLEAIREVTLLKCCTHPNIVRLLDVCTSSDISSSEKEDEQDQDSSSSASSSSPFSNWYLVMEAVDMDLSSLILGAKQYPFSEAHVKDLVHQLFSAVEAMHSKHVMHRDIKPANCLISRKGMLKLCDFGLARKFDEKTQIDQEKEMEEKYGLCFRNGVGTYRENRLTDTASKVSQGETGEALGGNKDVMCGSSSSTSMVSSMSRSASITMINDVLAKNEKKSENENIDNMSDIEEGNEEGEEQLLKQQEQEDAVSNEIKCQHQEESSKPPEEKEEEEKKFQASFFTEENGNSVGGTHTPRVVSGHYRPPEVLFGSREYDCSVDVWSAGCIVAELLARKVLFEGSSEEDQLTRVLQCLGEPPNSDTYNDLKRKSGYRMKHNVVSNTHANAIKSALEAVTKAKLDAEEAVAKEVIAAQELAVATKTSEKDKQNKDINSDSEGESSTNGLFDAASLDQARLLAAHKVATQKVKSAKWAIKRNTEAVDTARFSTLRGMFPAEGYDPRNVHADSTKPCSLSDVGFKTVLCACLEVDPSSRASATKVLESGWFSESPASCRLDEASISIAKRAADSAKRTAEKAKMINSFNIGTHQAGGIGGIHTGVLGVMPPAAAMNSAMMAAANAAQRLRTTGQGGFMSTLPPTSFIPSHQLSQYNTSGPPMPPALAMVLNQARGSGISQVPTGPTQEQLKAKEIAMAQARAQAKLIAQQSIKKD